MISLFRRSLDSWIVRGFFGVMTIAFVGWGISSNLTQLGAGGSAGWVAKVGDQTIDVPVFQEQYQQAVAQQARKLGTGQELTAEQRRQIGQDTLNRMISQASLDATLRKMRIVTPDADVAAAARAMPAFQGSDGQFSKAVFDNVLRNNGFTENHFLDQLRAELAQRQLMSAITGPAGAPDLEVKPLYNAEFEKRSADMALFPLAGAADPPAPDEAVLQRWYDNHTDSYTTPEFRRIKAIELSPMSLAAEIKVSDAELHTAYDQHKSNFETLAKRSAEVISAPDEAKATALATRWHDTPDWAAMQAAAQAAGASAINLDDATQVQFPDPDLAKAVFAEPSADAVSPPIKGALGWFVVKVTKITPGNVTPFETARPTILGALQVSKAADLMYDRANKVDQLLGSGTTLDDLPGDLGLAGVTGTLDSQGATPNGTPAPIPGPPELKSAIIAAAFQAHAGDPPALTEVQTPSNGGSAYYALSVEAVVPPGRKPFADVQDQVTADWKQDQRRRTEEQAATAMMVAVQGGKSFSDAATVAGVTPHLSPLITRDQRGQDVPPELQRVMFGLKKNDTTMVEVPEGFVVAQLTEIQPADPANDRISYDQARTATIRSMQNDLMAVYIEALRRQTPLQTNQAAFDGVVQTP